MLEALGVITSTKKEKTKKQNEKHTVKCES
jgi:hypothetical protein